MGGWPLHEGLFTRFCDELIKAVCGLVQFVRQAFPSSPLRLLLPKIPVVSFCLCLRDKISRHRAVEKEEGLLGRFLLIATVPVETQLFHKAG